MPRHADDYEAPIIFLNIIYNLLVLNLNWGTEIAEDAIWGRHLLMQHSFKDSRWVHKFGFTVDETDERSFGVADVIGFVAISDWQPPQSMEGKRIVTLNYDADGFMGFYALMAWTSLKDLQYDDQLKNTFDMWRLVYVKFELDGSDLGRKKVH